jgi:hypothetical protein
MKKSGFLSSSVETATAQTVTRVLNDRTLTPQQRLASVRKAQDRLVAHQQQQAQRQAVLQQLAAFTLPKGLRPMTVQVRDGQVLVGALKRGSQFVWIEAGAAPQGASANDDFRFESVVHKKGNA